MNARRPLLRVSFASIVLFLSGCSTFEGWNGGGSSSTKSTEITYLQEQVRLLTERVTSLEQRNANLEREVADLQTRLAQTQGGASAAELQQLRTQVQELQMQREKDKQAILDEVSKIVAGVAANRKAASSSTGGDVGYEHTVEKGQTLFDIARAYGVTVAAIKKANNLDSDLIRVGQVLFIPKAK